MEIIIKGNNYTYTLDNGNTGTLESNVIYSVEMFDGDFYYVPVRDRKAPVAVYRGRGTLVNYSSPVNVDVTTTVARPDSEHYHTGGIDVWKFAEANFSYDEAFGFHRIDAIKYLTRFGKKQGRNIRDLEKARAEIDEMIRMEKEREAE